MQVPIAHALAEAATALGVAVERLPLDLPSLSLAALGGLNFHDVDLLRFPALGLAYDALNAGQGACLALNAANEVAVAAFLASEARYTDIVPTVEKVLATADASAPTSMADVFERDAEMRRLAREALPESERA